MLDIMAESNTVAYKCPKRFVISRNFTSSTTVPRHRCPHNQVDTCRPGLRAVCRFGRVHDRRDRELTYSLVVEAPVGAQYPNATLLTTGQIIASPFTAYLDENVKMARNNCTMESKRLVLVCGDADKCHKTVAQQVYSSSKCTSGVPSNPDGTT